MIKGSHHLEDTKLKMSLAKKGKNHSEESKLKRSKAWSGEKNPNYGKSFSEEVKKRMSEACKGRHHSEETKRKISKARKDKKKSEETKKKMSEAQKGEKNYAWKGGKIKVICKICGKERHYKPSIIKKGQGIFCSHRCSGVWIVKHSKKKDTSIEIAIEKELIKRGIPYTKQVALIGVALVDFLLSDRIIIQCDGDYWHNRIGAKDRDANQDFVLSFNNYKVYRFTETEIKKSVKKCIDKIIKDKSINISYCGAGDNTRQGRR